ncbi:hypothetical protein [Luteibacter sp. 329MFSha]|uniref:hypothetical protein n=1 Tax=Luteibacter sp. 329MFSha TaxID=1798239 RepID=UPI0008BC93CA|nr:hypothetical protein [Luteibacter sp. 329MFSha]SEW24268.1 hypothetical protein SAMN04515660_3277 [Luteibacter sp. 329MFSha]
MIRAIRNAAMTLSLSASLVSPVCATSLAEVSGSWALHIEGKAMIVLHLGGDPATPAGELIQPKGMSVTNGLFSVASSIPEVHPLSRFEDKGEYALVTFRDAAGKTTELELRKKSAAMEVAIAGVPPEVGLGPWLFDRSSAKEEVAGDWQPGRSYVVGDTDKSNAEIERLYRQDQEIRQKPPADWSEVSRSDEARRKRTRELIASGSLHTGEDFKEAAFIMQHGTTSDDYLLAHSLALAAMAKGESSAAWIAAATLDRFLWSKNLPQIYGTQSKDDGKGGETSQPYNDNLVNDYLKRQLGANGVRK